MAIEHPQTMTVEEYFLLEENDPDTRYEYVDGQVYAMAGELPITIPSNQICNGFFGVFSVAVHAVSIAPT
jgi:Uma2 family endonuclease